MNVFSGNQKDLPSDQFSERKFIKNLLSNEQFKKYKKLRKEEESTAKNTLAHSELMQIQNLFDPSDE
ncbi:MAG: hypothetical protein AAGA18_14255 [Verrucomicrobiota bacterium]